MRDLNQLRVFEVLWNHRSVTRAAEALGLSQATVSGSLKQLREEFGDKLFTLVSRRMEPTPAAIALAPQLLQALALIRDASASQLRFDAATSERDFVIRTRDIGEVVCMPPLIQDLRGVAPGILLRTVYESIEATSQGLASGRIDLALGYMPSLEVGIHTRPLFKQHFVCAIRQGHPLAKRTLTEKEFVSSEHLLVEYSGLGFQNLERALVDAGARDRVRVRLPQYLAAPYFVMTSDLVWCLPNVLAEQLKRHYPIVVKPLPLEVPSYDVSLYWHDRFHGDPANQWMRSFIADRIKARRIGR